MGRPPAPVVLAEAFIWLLVVGVLFLLASHFFPQLHTAVQAVPSILNQAKDDIHAWWNTK
jgi:predicted PurR-regulated permease PerM